MQYAKQYFIYRSTTNDKFYNINLLDRAVFIVSGRVGTNGRKRNKLFDTDDKAIAYYTKQVIERLREGYLVLSGIPLTKIVAMPVGNNEEEKITNTTINTKRRIRI